MELVLFISLALASNYTMAHLQEANAEDSHADASSWLRITQTSKKRQFGEKEKTEKVAKVNAGIKCSQGTGAYSYLG
jgi:hypothetical protein